MLGKELLKMGAIHLLDEDGNVTLWFIALLFLVILVFYFILSTISKKKGVNSPEKQRIAEIINEVSNGDTSLTAAYAHWTTVESQANRSITRYWYYAIGFNRERIVVVPLSFPSKKPRKIAYKQFYVIEPDMLGLVNGKIRKNNSWMEMYDKSGNKIVSLSVNHFYMDSVFTREKVNIVQNEAADKWTNECIPYWMDKVNKANSTNATGYHNNAQALDFAGRVANPEGGGKAKNM